jgi:hypothetical protein
MGEQDSAEFPGQGGREPTLKEKPGMAAVAGLGSFDRHGDVKPGTGFPNNSNVFRPSFLIKVHGQETTGVARQQGIDTCNYIAA